MSKRCKLCNKALDVNKAHNDVEHISCYELRQTRIKNGKCDRCGKNPRHKHSGYSCYECYHVKSYSGYADSIAPTVVDITNMTYPDVTSGIMHSFRYNNDDPVTNDPLKGGAYLADANNFDDQTPRCRYCSKPSRLGKCFGTERYAVCEELCWKFLDNKVCPHCQKPSTDTSVYCADGCTFDSPYHGYEGPQAAITAGCNALRDSLYDDDDSVITSGYNGPKVEKTCKYCGKASSLAECYKYTTEHMVCEKLNWKFMDDKLCPHCQRPVHGMEVYCGKGCDFNTPYDGYDGPSDSVPSIACDDDSVYVNDGWTITKHKRVENNRKCTICKHFVSSKKHGRKLNHPKCQVEYDRREANGLCVKCGNEPTFASTGGRRCLTCAILRNRGYVGYDNLKDVKKKKKLKLKKCKLCHYTITCEQWDDSGFHTVCSLIIAERKRDHMCVRCGKNSVCPDSNGRCVLCVSNTPYTGYSEWLEKHNLEVKKRLDTTWQRTIAKRKRLHKCLRCGENDAVGGGRYLCKVCDDTTPYKK